MRVWPVPQEAFLCKREGSRQIVVLPVMKLLPFGKLAVTQNVSFLSACGLVAGAQRKSSCWTCKQEQKEYLPTVSSELELNLC